jgi:hypothetical protein
LAERTQFLRVRSTVAVIHPTARQLAMTADEAVDFYRRITHAPRTEAQRQADFKILSRAQPGPKSRANGNEQADKYLALMQECIAVHFPNMDRARIKFMQKAVDTKLCASKKTARNHWYRLLPTLKINRPSN